MHLRTKDTLAALSLMPEPRRSALPAPVVAPIAGDGGPCAGIDDCIRKTADTVGVPLTYLTSDSEFLRRVRLDLTGRIPTRAEVETFLADPSADKRARLVDALLQTPEWADRWALFFGDLFRNTAKTVRVNRFPASRDAFHLFLLDSLQANKPYDALAREMLAAEGTSDGRVYPDEFASFEHYRSVYENYEENPVVASPVGYVVGALMPGGPAQDTYDSLALVTARDFLGVSALDCVLCHDGAGHLDAVSVWGAKAKRVEGWGLAAFFSDIPRPKKWRMAKAILPVDPETGKRAVAHFYTIRDLEPGQLNRTWAGDTAGMYLAQTVGGNRPDRQHAEQEVLSAYPFGGGVLADPALRLREQVGLHLTADPQFARAAVNYVWHELFGRGIVEPPDQFDLARLDPGSPPPEGWEIQPSHPHLLEWLAKGFSSNGFDLKWLLREIATSQAYQLSSRYEGLFNPLYERYFVRHQVKRLTAEQVHDALLIASGHAVSYRASPHLQGLRFAMQLPDVVGVPKGGGSSLEVRRLLRSFLPGDRDRTSRGEEGSSLQALNLMNSPFVMDRVARKGSLLESLKLADDALVTDLFLRVLSRHPTEDELVRSVVHLQEGKRGRRASSLMWALFNMTEFYVNY